MPNEMLIEPAELTQLLIWIRDIEDDVKAIKAQPEDPDDTVERCRGILRTLLKMKGMLTVLRY